MSPQITTECKSMPVNVKPSNTVQQQLNESSAIPAFSIFPNKGNNKFFKFKGISLAASKSLKVLNSGGLSLKVPVTGHFPGYDSVHYYPRLGSSTSMLYPLSYRFTLTFSIPVLTAFYFVGVLCNKLKLTRKSYMNQLKKHYDPSKRVGFVVSFRYSAMKGFELVVGPWLYSSFGKQIMDVLLPVFLLLPTLLAALLSLFASTLAFFTKVTGLSSEPTISLAANSRSIVDESESSSDSTATSPTTSSTSSSASNPLKTEKSPQYRVISSVRKQYQDMLQWLRQLQPIIGTTLLLFASSQQRMRKVAVGPVVFAEIPFSPARLSHIATVASHVLFPFPIPLQKSRSSQSLQKDDEALGKKQDDLSSLKRPEVLKSKTGQEEDEEDVKELLAKDRTGSKKTPPTLRSTKPVAVAPGTSDRGMFRSLRPKDADKGKLATPTNVPPAKKNNAVPVAVSLPSATAASVSIAPMNADAVEAAATSETTNADDRFLFDLEEEDDEEEDLLDLVF